MSLVLDTPVSSMTGPYRRRWAALTVLCACLLVVVMANTSLIVAIPSMSEDLKLTSAQLQWVIDGYTVPYAALMLLFGALGDRFGRRRALVLGMLVFGVGSVLGSVANSTEEVIAWRMVMGIGAASIMPATLSLLVVTFPRAERARAIAIWAATSGLGIALGPLLAGSVLRHWFWGATFLVNVPVVIVGTVAALALVPPSRVPATGSIDWLGGILSIVLVGASVYAIIDGLHGGWTVGPLVAAAASVVALAVFVLWEMRHPRPLLSVRRLSNRKISGSLLSVGLLFLAAFGSIYFVSQQFQFIFGYGPLEAGIRLLPLALAVSVGSIVSGRLLPVLGERVLISAGMAIAAAGVLVLTQLDAGSGYEWFLVSLVILGVGMGVAEPPATDAIMGGFDESELGSAGGINDTAIEYGGALGIALLGSVLANTYTSTFGERVESFDIGSIPEPLRADATNAAGAASESVGSATVVAHALADNGATAPFADVITDVARTSFTAAIESASWVGGAVLVMGTAVVAAVLPGRRLDSADSGHNQK
ncbi:MFS transporter [Rhodococcus sp. 05-340-1]|uniref:MFS transporter n=1 Tax=Nocardiaceae TaxID=85025 RepID=UPI00050CC668|nr:MULTISPECIES: MFS transporter [Rhodococcus]OZC87857.1 MFS transporter [Rhodococcus sp. 06-412-2C]OZC96506.1 MFS transporter [Rhodococcus sp. 06-412-2B]OZD65451.1 MFS transporter [Rhodococcus sp. 05-340-2]OZD74683.1 MFS transporter [Rhodococcus sp. 05-340-1]OZD86739.1 MFS transporter [Rhodococcus sp. 05-339-2]